MQVFSNLLVNRSHYSQMFMGREFTRTDMVSPLLSNLKVEELPERCCKSNQMPMVRVFTWINTEDQ